jgi:hypothetical protein
VRGRAGSGGRGSGKSWHMRTKVVLRCLKEPGIRVVCAGADHRNLYRHRTSDSSRPRIGLARVRHNAEPTGRYGYDGGLPLAAQVAIGPPLRDNPCSSGRI